jgi:hypothetical protein
MPLLQPVKSQSRNYTYMAAVAYGDILTATDSVVH